MQNVIQAVQQLDVGFLYFENRINTQLRYIFLQERGNIKLNVLACATFQIEATLPQI